MVAPHLSSCDACSHGLTPFDKLIELCESGASQLWVMMDEALNVVCTAVTELQDYPGGKAMRCWMVGGDVERGFKHGPEFDGYAREQGCSHILVDVPPDKRRLLRENFEVSHVVMVRRVP